MMLMYIVVRSSLGMSPGKMAAQVGHAAHLSMRLNLGPEYNWIKWNSGEYGKIILAADEKDWIKLKALPDAVVVVDNGHTELDPGTETVVAFAPMRKEDRPGLLKRLRLLAYII